MPRRADPPTPDAPPAHAPEGAAPFRRVRKAYEQVADQLRDLILSGELEPGARLPTEQTLARDFGVSRATVREALRVLATQNLIRTTKGATGGSFVILPTADHISDFLSSNISLLSQTETVSLDEFLELREFLEVPAARLAARRHTPEALERLQAAIPGHPRDLGTEEQFIYNKDFHSQVVLASENTLLSIAVQPIFSVMQTNLSRSALGRRFHDQINDDHRAIATAIAAGDEDAAAEEMHRHLAYLRPFYEKAWRSLKR
jgi:DNA-binding FadR family transcriptional regulator